jgi:hypothetical protein
MILKIKALYCMRLGGTCNRYKTVDKILVRKPERKRPVGKPVRRWEKGIKMYLKECGGREE